MKQYCFSILSAYVIILTLFPVFSDVFLWMAGSFNHFWATTLNLIVAIPFRLLLDDYDIFSKHKILKYFYFILCITSGFSVENVTPWLIVYMGIIIFIQIKKRNIKAWLFISPIITSISFLIMCTLSQTKARINLFSNMDWAINSKKHLVSIVIDMYKPIFILIIVLLIFCIFLMLKNKKIKNFLKQYAFLLVQLCLSTISIFVIYFAPYFVSRTTVLFFFFLLTLIVYMINIIFVNRKILIIGIIISLFIVIVMNLRLIFFYKDFNQYNNLRYNYMKDQYESGKKELVCPLYDNKYKYINIERLTQFEWNYCESMYIRYLFNDNEINIIQKYINIR